MLILKKEKGFSVLSKKPFSFLKVVGAR